MDFPQLLGSFYTLFSPKAEVESAKNLYLERIESGNGRNAFAMYRSPGLQVFTDDDPTTSTAIRGMFELNDGLFDVRGNTVRQINSAGHATAVLTPIDDDGELVTMTGNETTLFIVSAGTLYRVIGGSLSTISTPFVPASVATLQGYIICLAENGREFFFSTDGLTWNALDVQTAEAAANNLVNLIVDHQELWLFGNRITQVFALGTDPNAPFNQIQSAVITQGLAAKFALCALDNSIFWLGKNKDGDHIVWRANGYTPVRVSNHAVENAIRRASAHDDAFMWTYQLNGHACLRLTLPSAKEGLGETWEYDVTTGQWSQPLWWNPQTGLYERHRGNCAVSAFDKILVGDHDNGLIYEMSPDYYYDFGFPLRWERRTPHLVAGRKRVQYKRFDLFMETGVGLTEPLWLNDHSLDPDAFAIALAGQTNRDTLLLWRNGVLQQGGAGNDYTLNDATIETVIPVAIGEYFTAMYFTESAAPFVLEPDGTIPGSAFTLPNTPGGGLLLLFKNGLLIEDPDDYDLTGDDITMVVPLVAGDRLQALYYTDAVPPMTSTVPTGATPGLVFTLPSTPTAGTLRLFRNGLLLQDGTDYTLAGTILIMSGSSGPVAAGEHFRAVYFTTSPAAVVNEVPDGAVPGTTFTLSATPEFGELTALEVETLQRIYDYEPYIPLDPYPDPEVMHDLGFYPWGAVTELDDGTVLGEPPQVGMAYSNNGAKTFTPTSYRSIGSAGDYDAQMYWLRCGEGRDRVWEISGDAPVLTSIVGGEFEAKVCQS